MAHTGRWHHRDAPGYLDCLPSRRARLTSCLVWRARAEGRVAGGGAAVWTAASAPVSACRRQPVELTDMPEIEPAEPPPERTSSMGSPARVPSRSHAAIGHPSTSSDSSAEEQPSDSGPFSVLPVEAQPDRHGGPMGRDPAPGSGAGARPWAASARQRRRLGPWPSGRGSIRRRRQPTARHGLAPLWPRQRHGGMTSLAGRGW